MTRFTTPLTMLRECRFVPAWLSLAFVIGTAGCFERPVVETVTIQVLEDDRLMIKARTEVRDLSDEGNLAARRRVAHVRREVLDQADPWSRRFGRIDPLAETYHWQKHEGALESVERSALIEAEELVSFFSDTSLSVFVSGHGDWREISIHPGTSQRATIEQQQLLERSIDPWTGSISDYFRELEILFSYLERRPDRAYEMYARLFEEYVSEEILDVVELTEAEQQIVEGLREKMQLAWKVLEVRTDEAYSVNEISRLVYDPFPCDLQIVLSGEPLEYEGFELEEKGLVVKRIGLWEALHEARSRWASPDPLTLWVDAALNSSRIDLEQLASMPRTLDAPPSGIEIRRELEKKLRPHPVYRVRWQAHVPKEEAPADPATNGTGRSIPGTNEHDPVPLPLDRHPPLEPGRQ